MAGELEAAEGELGNQVPDMEAVPGRIEAAIKGDRPAGQAGPQGVEVGAIGEQTAPLEIFEDGHGGK